MDTRLKRSMSTAEWLNMRRRHGRRQLRPQVKGSGRPYRPSASAQNQSFGEVTVSVGEA